MLTLDAEVQGNVTVLEPRPASGGSLDNTHLAVGYKDGTIAIFDLRDGQPVKFTGKLVLTLHRLYCPYHI